MVGNGYQIKLGMDRIIGVNSTGLLSTETLQLLHDRGLFYLNQVHICHTNDRRDAHWLTARALHLSGTVGVEWQSYTNGLTHVGIVLNEYLDTMVWENEGVDGTVSTVEAYTYYVEMNRHQPSQWWHSPLWQWEVQVKIKLFIWLGINNCLMTGE